MTDASPVSLGLAFLAGLVSFLSPCVLPIVPSYVSFVTGLTLDELRAHGGAAARRHAALNAGLFILGFSVLFIALGASASALGAAVTRALPLLQQVGGVVIALFGLYLLGVLRVSALMRERRIQLASRPAGALGSIAAGLAFGAGWTPCIGPVLASILLYASLEATAPRGMMLLAAYALGLGVPFFVAAVALNAFLTRTRWLRRWMLPLQRVMGAFLIILGVLLFTGRFAVLSSFLAGFGQVIDLEVAP
ncbi:MAG: cytochrome c biogenesis protein CcdA [bacterium]|jgi:cytochrome c-type biogenesis protein|nr:MAG: cytochrome C biogenesis protein [bacterium]